METENKTGPNQEITDQDSGKAISDDDIKSFVNLLEQSTSKDEEIRLKAISVIEKGIFDNIIRSLVIFSTIIQTPDIDKTCIYLSMQYIKNIFTPSPPITDEFIFRRWQNIPSDYHIQVKSAIYHGFKIPDQQITTISSQTLVSLLNIEKVQGFDMISELFTFYETAENSEETKNASIQTLSEICSEKSLGQHTEYAEVQEQIINIFTKICIYFTNCLKEPIEIKNSICDAIINLLKVAPILLQSKDTVLSLIQISIDHLKSIQNSNDSKLNQFHSKLLTILFEIIKIHYNNEEFNPKDIFEYVNMQILNFNDRSDLFQGIAINCLNFWVSLSKFERQIVKKNFYKSKLTESLDMTRIGFPYNIQPGIFRSFSSIGLDQLTEKLIVIMGMIDPTDNTTKIQENKTADIVATLLLQSFFKLDPDFIFNKIKKFWNVEMKKYSDIINAQTEKEKVPPTSLNWIIDHKLILSISIFCSKTIIPHQIDAKIIDFFTQPFICNFYILKDYVLGTCLTKCDIPKIIEICLHSLSYAFKNVPILFDNKDLEIILNWIKKNIEIEDPQILTIIYILISVIYSNRVTPNLLLRCNDILFDSIKHLIQLFQIGISLSDSNKFIYPMISNVIRFAINYKNNLQIQKNLIISNPTNFDNIIEAITELIDSQFKLLKEYSQNKEYEKIKDIIYFFDSIFTINQSCITKFDYILDDLLTELINLLSISDLPIFEDCLICINIIIRKIKIEKANLFQEVGRITDFCLQSKNIENVCCAIEFQSKLFNFLIQNRYPGYEKLIEQFPIKYEMIKALISNGKLERKNYPRIIRSLAKLIYVNSENIKSKNQQLIDEFITEFEGFSKFPISVHEDEPDEIEFANSFYESIFYFATSILKCISSDNKLACDRKLMRLFMSAFTDSFFSKLEFHFSDGSIHSICSFYGQFLETFGRKGDIILNRKTNYKILAHGTISKNKSIQQEARNTINQLKNS